MAMKSGITANAGHRGMGIQEALTSASVMRLRRESDLRQAIVHGDMELSYQPKVSLPSHTICGVAALLAPPAAGAR